MQLTFGDAEDLGQRKQTRREVFLGEMEQVVPWKALLALIEPHYPKLGRPGRQPYALATMLRIHFLQQWYALSDPAMEEALYDTPVMRRFAGIGGLDGIPDETTILNFRRLLETHGLAAKLLARVNAHLQRKGMSLRSGTIVDATIIAAPSSTKNAEGKRDPEMRQTRKGKDWHFGMKVHVGTTKQGLVHTLATGPASEGDITRLDDLLHGEEVELYGDQAYWSEDHRQHCKHAGIRYRVNRRGHSTRPLTAHQRLINRSRSRCRARGEHAFHVIKRLWGFAKVRYRGLAKNTARVFAVFALANLYLVRRRLLPQGARCAP